MDPVLGGRRPQRGRIGQTRHQQAHAPEVEDRVLAAESVGQHPAGLGCGEVPFRDDRDDLEIVGQWQGGVRGRALDRGGRDEPAEHAGGGILRVTVVRRRDGEGIVGPGGGGRGRRQGGRGAQPAGDRDLRAHRHREAVVPEHLGDHARRQVGGIVEEPRALALRVHAQCVGRLHLDADVAVDGDRQGVEAGAEVGRGGGGPGAHGGQATRSEQALEQRALRDVAGEVRGHDDALRAERDHDGARQRATPGLRAQVAHRLEDAGGAARPAT